MSRPGDEARLFPAWDTYGRTPITEQEVQEEMKRLDEQRS